MYFRGSVNDFLEKHDKFIDVRSYSSSNAGSEDGDAAHEYPEYPNYLNSLSPVEKSSAIERYENLKKSYWWEKEEHPTRTNPYTLSAMVYKSTQDPEDRMWEIDSRRRSKIHIPIHDESTIKKEEKQDFHMLAFVQQLSNLSNSIRQDLGTVMWAHTKLQFFGSAALTSGPLACLMERPGIMQGISCISLDIMSKDWEGHQEDSFNLICLYLSRHVKLQHLQINLCASGYRGFDMEPLIASCRGSEVWKTVGLLRSIAVSRSFEVQLVESDEGTRWLSVEKISKREKSLRELSDCFLPDTFRNSPATQVLTTIQNWEEMSFKTILEKKSS